jgi:hypothetical protein
MDDTRIQLEINKYKKFKKVDGATYRKVNQFLRKRTYITAREWALARLCTDFRTSGGAEMTFIGQHLPELVPFMEDTYSPQAVNQARNSFKKKVRKASSTFFYGAMCGFFTTDELDDLLFEASEVARFLLEVEGTTLDIDEEIDIEDRITEVMRGVGEAAKTILKARGEDVDLPNPIIQDSSVTQTEISLQTEQSSVNPGELRKSEDEEHGAGIDPYHETAHFEQLIIENSLVSVSPHEILNPYQTQADGIIPIKKREISQNNTKDCTSPENKIHQITPGQSHMSDSDEEDGASP